MFSLILLNGGIGSRVGANQPKQLIRLNQIPIFIYTLRIADALPEISEIVLNYPEGWEEQIRELTRQYAIQKPLKFVPAGASRQESVSLMLNEVGNDDVLIHEAARPLISEDDFNVLMKHSADNVSLTLPVPFTVLLRDETGEKIGGVLDRSSLLNIQLPQKFKTADLMAAHALAAKTGKSYTEDAAMLFEAGSEVYFVHGNERNFKITTLQDVHIAEIVASGKREHLQNE